MAKAVLRRFDVRLLRNKSATDESQIPAPPGTRVDVYRQGSSLKSDVSIVGGGASTWVPVYTFGSIAIGDQVSLGVGGPVLNVADIDVPNINIKLTNAGLDLFARAGTRLIRTSSRPSLYDDPFGTGIPSSFATADPAGSVAEYINEVRFDHVADASFSPIAVEALSTIGRHFSGNLLEFALVASSNLPGRVLVVSVAIQSSAGEHVLAVTCNNVSLAPLFSQQSEGVYYLIAPPVGNCQLNVTLSGTGTKGVVAAALVLSGADQSDPIGTAYVSTGTGSSVSIAAPTVNTKSMLLDLLGVFSAGSAGVAFITTGGPQQLLQWEEMGGLESDGTIVQAVQSTSPGTGSPVTIGWSLGGQTRAWTHVAVEVRPVGIRLSIDTEGSAFTRSAFGVNVRDYHSIADAVDDAPDGGLVYLPPMTYSPTSVPSFTSGLELPDRKSLHLLGAGPANTRLFVPVSPPPPSDKVIQITSDYQTLEGFSIVGEVSPSLPASLRGILVHRKNPTNLPHFRVVVKECNFESIPNWNLVIDDTGGAFSVFCSFRDLDFQGNRSPGCILIGSVTTTQYFERIRVHAFKGCAVRSAGNTSNSFRDSSFEDGDETQPYVYLDNCNQFLLDQCFFRGAAVSGSPTALIGEFVRATSSGSGTFYGLTINNCRFRRDGGQFLKAIVLDKVASGAVILNPFVDHPTAIPVAATGGEHINITNGASSVTIVGGSVASDNPSVDIQVKDSSNRSMLLGTMRRIRLPRADPSLLKYPRAGDMIFDVTVLKAKVYDGTAWISLWA